jgi:hypothetical protein
MNESEKDAEIARLRRLLEEATRPVSAMHSTLTALLDARPFRPFHIKSVVGYEFGVTHPSQVALLADAITITDIQEDGDAHLTQYYHIPLGAIAYLAQTRVVRKSSEPVLDRGSESDRI